ncbi:MAG TPA: hypothetical protein VKB67_11105 [Rhizomicrobium sp.]|nr:hypothetical protein [Rhizomicrobium sp.]
MQKLLDCINGPVPNTVLITVIIATIVMLTLAESGGALRRIGGILLGIVIALAAARWGMTLFGFN